MMAANAGGAIMLPKCCSPSADWLAIARPLLALVPNPAGMNLPYSAYAPQPNETFNADANIGHRFAILMANVGTLRPCRASGAG
jgi:hypothetical protein